MKNKVFVPTKHLLFSIIEYPIFKNKGELAQRQVFSFNFTKTKEEQLQTKSKLEVKRLKKSFLANHYQLILYAMGLNIYLVVSFMVLTFQVQN